jgi:hypothetical protein
MLNCVRHIGQIVTSASGCHRGKTNSGGPRLPPASSRSNLAGAGFVEVLRLTAAGGGGGVGRLGLGGGPGLLTCALAGVEDSVGAARLLLPSLTDGIDGPDKETGWSRVGIVGLDVRSTISDADTAGPVPLVLAVLAGTGAGSLSSGS